MDIFDKMATSPLFNPQPTIKAGKEEAFLQAAAQINHAPDPILAANNLVAEFVEVK